MSEQELALVANLQLQTAEEAKTLVPTLVCVWMMDKDDFDFHVFIAVSYTMYFVWFQVRFEDDDLNRLLAEIEAYREFE